jgi:hypothetical protein
VEAASFAAGAADQRQNGVLVTGASLLGDIALAANESLG